MANVGDKLRHKDYSNITIELVEPTNKGWKVIQRDPNSLGKKEKKTSYPKMDLFGPRALFEPITNEEKNNVTMKHVKMFEDFLNTHNDKLNEGWEAHQLADFLNSNVEEFKDAVGISNKLSDFEVYTVGRNISIVSASGEKGGDIDVSDDPRFIESYKRGVEAIRIKFKGKNLFVHNNLK